MTAKAKLLLKLSKPLYCIGDFWTWLLESSLSIFTWSRLNIKLKPMKNKIGLIRNFGTKPSWKSILNRPLTFWAIPLFILLYCLMLKMSLMRKRKLKKLKINYIYAAAAFKLGFIQFCFLLSNEHKFLPKSSTLNLKLSLQGCFLMTWL